MTNHPNRTAPTLPETLPQALAEARARAGLSQTAAARLVGASLRTWQQWEDGGRSVPLTAIELWCVVAVAEGHLQTSDPLVRMWVRPSLLSTLKQRPPLSCPTVKGIQPKSPPPFPPKAA